MKLPSNRIGINWAGLLRTVAIGAFVLLISPSTSLAFSSRSFSSRSFSSRSVSSTSVSSSNKMEAETFACSEKSQHRFRGKNILLTGASGGLGKSLALSLTRCGARHIILSGRDDAALALLAKRCDEISQGMNSKTVVEAMPCDLSSDAGTVGDLGKKADLACGGVDVLINNGGISSRSRFIDTEIGVDELLMRVNFLSGAVLAKSVVPGMIERGEGAVIWVSSVQGLLGIPNRSSYAASKFAVQGYCESVRSELATSGVKVHLISPGYIRTDLSRSAITGNGLLYNKMDPATAEGSDPDEVAVTILDSVSDGKLDIIVAASFSARAAMWLRVFAPSLLQQILIKRYVKSQEEA